jgi:predicted DNA-binding protein
MTGVRFDEATEERLNRISRRTGRSVSALIREAVAAKLEDWEDLAEAIEGLQNPGRTWSLEELEAGLDKTTGGLGT